MSEMKLLLIFSIFNRPYTRSLSEIKTDHHFLQKAIFYKSCDVSAIANNNTSSNLQLAFAICYCNAKLVQSSNYPIFFSTLKYDV